MRGKVVQKENGLTESKAEVLEKRFALTGMSSVSAYRGNR